MASVGRAVARVLVRSSAGRTVAVAPVARGLASKVPAEQGYIPDIEGLTGRARAEAAYKRAYGEDMFNRDPTAAMEEGTRENPIPILSVQSERIVGISLPDDAEVRWFTLNKGELAYDPDTCNFFALKQVTQEQVDEWVKRAEQQVIGAEKH